MSVKAKENKQSMDVEKTNTTPHFHCRMPDEQTRVMPHPKSRDSSAGGAGRNTVLSGERLGQDAKAWDRVGCKICQRDKLLR